MVKTHARPTIALAPRLAAFSLSSIRSSSLISDFSTGDTRVDVRLKLGKPAGVSAMKSSSLHAQIIIQEAVTDGEHWINRIRLWFGPEDFSLPDIIGKFGEILDLPTTAAHEAGADITEDVPALHLAGNHQASVLHLVRVVSSHWSRSFEILCSHWL